MNGWLTTQDLLHEAAERGHCVTVRNLEDWRAAGLLPRGRRRGKGQGRGLLWRFPPESRTQLVDLIAQWSPREPISALAVRLWLHNYPVAIPCLRRHLEKAVMTFTERARAQVERRGIVGVGEAFAERVWRSREARTRYGVRRTDKHAYERVQGAAETIAATIVDPELTPSRDEVERLTSLMNLSDGESALIHAIDGDLTEEARMALHLIATTETMLAQASNHDLVEARGLWRAVTALVASSEMLPVENPGRAIIQRMRVVLDSPLGFVWLLQTLHRLRKNGTADPVAAVESILQSKPSTITEMSRDASRPLTL